MAITLPQLGRAAGAQSINDTPRLADELEISDLWLNDHIGFAPETEHPSPQMYKPLTCLVTATAVTSRIGIGSKIAGAYYPPVLETSHSSCLPGYLALQ